MPNFKYPIYSLLSFVFLLAFLMFFVQQAHAATVVRGEAIENPVLASKVVFEVNQSGNIQVGIGEVQWVEINLTTPQEDAYQDVDRRGENYVRDALANQLVNKRLENPGNYISYATSARVTVKQRTVEELPVSYTIPDDIKIFLKPTEHIQSDSAEIKSAAENVTVNAAMDIEKVAALAVWVHDYVTYDLNYGDVAKDALWVLENRRGVCDEYSTLFIALARASGIPARYVSTFAYGENGWEAHGIAEVYLGEWVLVDPLWLQLGHIDATHVRYTVQEDNQVINSVVVFGGNVGDISWREEANIFDTLDVEYEPKLSAQVNISASELDPGDEFVVSAKLSAPDYRLEDLTLEPCTSAAGHPTLVTINDKKARVLLAPNEEKLVVWYGRVSSDLQGGYRWTCPLTLNARYFNDEIVNLSIGKKDLGPASVISVTLQKIFDAVANFFSRLVALFGV